MKHFKMLPQSFNQEHNAMQDADDLRRMTALMFADVEKSRVVTHKNKQRQDWKEFFMDFYKSFEEIVASV